MRHGVAACISRDILRARADIRLGDIEACNVSGAGLYQIRIIRWRIAGAQVYGGRGDRAQLEKESPVRGAIAGHDESSSREAFHVFKVGLVPQKGSGCV